MDEQFPDLPNPGSDEALDQGCTCPIFDNSHGDGYHGLSGQFVVNFNCPIHSDQTAGTTT